MKAYKATDDIPTDNPTILIVADAGIGKTTLGYGADRGILADADLGAHRAKNRRDTVRPESFKDLEELISGGQDTLLRQEFGKSFADYATFVGDTAGAILDFLTLDIIDKNPKHGAAGALFRDGWGQLKTRFAGFKNQLVAQKKSIVFLCHSKEEKQGERTIVRPAVQGGSLAVLLNSADVIGYYHMEGKQRVIDWNPSDSWIAKSPGWPQSKVPDFDKDGNFLAGIQERAKNDLGKMSAESRAAAQQIADLLASIETTDKLEELNTLLKNKDAVPVYVRAQIRPTLMKRAETLGGVYEQKAGVFVAKQVQAVA
jgi:hypothetical protein